MLAAEYQRRPNLQHVPERARSAEEESLVFQTISNIYRTLLDKVEKMGLRVFQERASLTKFEKLALAGKTAISTMRGS